MVMSQDSISVVKPCSAFTSRSTLSYSTKMGSDMAKVIRQRSQAVRHWWGSLRQKMPDTSTPVSITTAFAFTHYALCATPVLQWRQLLLANVGWLGVGLRALPHLQRSELSQAGSTARHPQAQTRSMGRRAPSPCVGTIPAETPFAASGSTSLSLLS